MKRKEKDERRDEGEDIKLNGIIETKQITCLSKIPRVTPNKTRPSGEKKYQFAVRIAWEHVLQGSYSFSLKGQWSRETICLRVRRTSPTKSIPTKHHIQR